MLCVWLPFVNGTVKNQGLIDTVITDNGTSSYDSGKLGKCRSFVGAGYLQLSTGIGIEENKDFSCCYWIKEIANNTLSQFRVVYQTGNLIIGHYGKYFNIYSASGLDFMVEADTSQWTHCCITYNHINHTLYIYINGIQRSEKILTTFTKMSGTTSLIGKRDNNTTYLEGYLNDFRIYDECLSPKQVHSIAQGLVCHYSLGDIDGKIGGRNLLLYSLNPLANCSNGYYKSWISVIDTQDMYNGCSVYKTKNAWSGLKFNFKKHLIDRNMVNIGDVLTYSVMAKTDNVASIRIWMFARYTGQSSVETISSQVLTNEWKKYSVTFTVTKKMLAEATMATVFGFEQSLTCEDGKYVYYACQKLEKGNKATPYTLAPEDSQWIYDNIIYDTSGYGNNGSVSGDILWDTNTPRYRGAYDFNGTGYIYNDNLNLITTAFTISFWIKIPSTITHQHFDFATFNSWTSEGVGIYWDTSGQKSSSGGIFGKDSNGDKIHVGVQCRGKLNEWTHFAITWDGTKVCRYSNGIKFSESDFNAVSVYHPRLWLGNSTFGDRTLENSESCMSDFRFYTTALSDFDVLELYQSSASVDNNGNLMLAGEVIEE